MDNHQYEKMVEGFNMLHRDLDSINGKLTFFMVIVILGLIISFLGSCFLL